MKEERCEEPEDEVNEDSSLPDKQSSTTGVHSPSSPCLGRSCHCQSICKCHVILITHMYF